jgi:hypothetical protein
MRLPELNITGASIRGISKLDTNAEGYVLEWQGQTIGLVIFGRSGWVGKMLYQPLNLRGQAVAQPVRSLPDACRALITYWEKRHDSA